LIADRETFSAHSPGGRLAYWLDRAACHLADHILLDTWQHVDYFTHTFGIPHEKFSALPVGCNEELFSPRPSKPLSNSIRVLYYTTYMPLHGVETVVQAASLLKDEAIHFRLVGDGPTHKRVREIARQLGVKNIEFIPYLPLEQLPGEIAAADICLGGHFGTSDKAGRVVPGKVYQVLAMARPLIATATPANLDLLVHGKSAYICPPDDAPALAAALLELSGDTDLRQRLATGGRERYLERCSEAVITNLLKGVIDQMVGE
jgi:glycosyltransferase involved in cell wall biosynthesis